MSDIIDKTPPPEEVMTGPIYLIGIPTQNIHHYAGEGQLISSGGPFQCFRFEHKGRVIGYRDSVNNCLYLLGNEAIKFNVLNGTTYSMWCGFNSRYISHITEPPLGWSTGYAQDSDTWRIGMLVGSSYDVIAPLAPINLNWNSHGGSNVSITDYLQSYHESGGGYQLSTKPESSIRFKSYKDNQQVGARVFNENLLIYSNALNQIVGLAKGAYGKVKADPGSWTMFMGGGGAFGNYYNMVASNLIITANAEQAKRYVEDGTLPDDYIYNDPTKPPSGSDDKDGDDPNNGGEGNSGSNKRDKIPPHEPKETAATFSNVHLYALDKSQLQGFINNICTFDWGTIATNALTGIYNNLTDSIQSIKVFPFASSTLGTVSTVNNIICGFYSFDGKFNGLKPNTTIHDAGTFEFKESFGGWADYAPYTDIDLYLPYFGWLKLDTNMFMKHSVNVKYTLDVLMGTITYLILCDETTVMTKTTKVAADVPISLASNVERFRDTLSNVATFGSNIAGGRPIGLLTGSTTVSAPHLVTEATESGMFYMPTKCAVRITRPAYTRAKNYDARYGYPCYGAYQLSKLKGFTVIENYKSHYTKGIKKEEADMIKSLMESGVYL